MVIAAIGSAIARRRSDAVTGSTEDGDLRE